MLTLIFLMIGKIFTMWLAPKKKTWLMSTTQSSLIFLLSLSTIMLPKNFKKWKCLSYKLSSDSTKTNLIILSFWLIPVSLLASMGHLQKSPKLKKQMFFSLILLILMFLMMTFSSTKIMLFFLGFEATLTPTLLLMVRWGKQQERMEAGYYFVFYTLMSSLPLFLSILTLYKKENHSSIPLFLKTPPYQKKVLPMFCLLAFLVKVPIFGLHLWLPKAHVEAPVAGSMILAAMLLKMGGYGFIRLTHIFWLNFSENMAPLLMPFCCWGGLLTSMMCLTQTDLKSLMAYSSVSHMSFMMAGLSTLTNWAISGGMMMMMAHGLVSSALFCMAKMYYERSHTRTLTMKRGMKKSISLLSMLWLLFACAKLGLPPLPKSFGELLVFSSMMGYSMSKFMPSLMGMLFTSMFSLSIYQLLNSGSNFKWKILKTKILEREYLTLILHLIPLTFLMTTPKSMMK